MPQFLSHSDEITWEYQLSISTINIQKQNTTFSEQPGRCPEQISELILHFDWQSSNKFDYHSVSSHWFVYDHRGLEAKYEGGKQLLEGRTNSSKK